MTISNFIRTDNKEEAIKAHSLATIKAKLAAKSIYTMVFQMAARNSGVSAI